MSVTKYAVFWKSLSQYRDFNHMKKQQMEARILSLSICIRSAFNKNLDIRTSMTTEFKVLLIRLKRFHMSER